MAGLYIRKIFVRVFSIDRIKKWKVQTKVGSVFVGGTLVAVAVAEYEGYISGIFAVYGYLKKWIDDIENENDIQDGRGNIVKDFMREKTKEMGRRNMIGNGVGQGLAWLHYAAYLHHVLPDIGNKVQQSEWYKGLSADEQRRLPMKLYEFIPRTCSIDIPGTDDSIQLETEITIDTNKKIKIPIYSIKDGKTMYYCMCKCPDELKTMNNVNDIQMAGISRSKYKLFQFPWNRVPTVQLFTVDTKLVQLMRFYYTLSSLLCLNNNGDRVRLLLLNESETKPSNVLLQAIKEEIQDTSSEKKLPSLFMKVKLTAEECKESIYDLEVFVSNPEDALIGKCGTLKHTEKNISLVTNGLDTNMNTSNDSCQKATEDPKVDILKQKTHRSLMENKLLSAEERKDVSYDFDVFVTHQNEVHDKEREHMKANYKDVERVNKALVARNMTILKEEDCRGQDWLTKLKYAATKCRWIVFLDKNETNNELFTSHKVTDSLKAILESRKVQSVAIVNTENESHVLDALRWITCLPYQKDIEYVVETLYKVVSGSEIKLKNSRDLYHKPGEYAVGLAWYYAANHLNRILPIMNQAVTKAMKEQNIPLPNIPKFFVFIPESFKTSEFLKDARPRPDQYTDYSPENKIPNRIAVYMLSKGQKQPKYYVGEYPTPLTMIRQIKEVGLLNEDETKLEVEKFYKTVNKIMAILLPKYRTDYEFVIFNDEQEELDDALIRIFQKEELRETAERIACTDCIINSLF